MTPSLHMDPDGDLWLCVGDEARFLGLITRVGHLVPPDLRHEWWALLDDYHDLRTGLTPWETTPCPTAK